MYKKIPPTTKQYLSLLIEDKIQENRGDNFINFKKSYLSKFDNLQETDCSKYFGFLSSGKPLSMYIPPECLKAYQEKVERENMAKNSKGSGAGVGSSEKSKNDDTTTETKDDNRWGILDVSTMKDPIEILGGPGVVGGAAGSYILGGLGELIAKGTLAPKVAGAITSRWPGFGNLAGGAVGEAIGKAGEAFSDIAGKQLLKQQSSDIAFENMRNLLGGAGSPPHRLFIPIRKQNEYDFWRRQGTAV